MIKIYASTDIGLVRKTNQDCYAHKVMGGLLGYAVLCDGMGGEGGHVASETAMRFADEVLARDLKPGMSEISLKNVMMSVAAGANALVFEAVQKDLELEGIGTTLIIAVVFGESVFVCSVGDSRAYHISGGKKQQLTKDHTIVQMLLDIGEISPEEAQTHPKRHYITRAVGVAPGVDADFIEHPFAPGDMLLLCSDGLYNFVGDENMTETVLGAHLQQSIQSASVDNLIDLAKNVGGGGDNITAILICRQAEKTEGGCENGAARG